MQILSVVGTYAYSFLGALIITILISLTTGGIVLASIRDHVGFLIIGIVAFIILIYVGGMDSRKPVLRQFHYNTYTVEIKEKEAWDDIIKTYAPENITKLYDNREIYTFTSKVTEDD